jgi:hypothetical protein
MILKTANFIGIIPLNTAANATTVNDNGTITAMEV